MDFYENKLELLDLMAEENRCIVYVFTIRDYTWRKDRETGRGGGLMIVARPGVKIMKVDRVKEK